MPSRTTKSKPRSSTRARGTKKEKRTTKSRKTEKLRVSSRRPSRRSKRSSRSTYKGRFENVCITKLQYKYSGLNDFKQKSFLKITGAKKVSSMRNKERNVYVVKVTDNKFHVIWTDPKKDSACRGLAAISDIDRFIMGGFMLFKHYGAVTADIEDEIQEKMFDFSNATFAMKSDTPIDISNKIASLIDLRYQKKIDWKEKLI